MNVSIAQVKRDRESLERELEILYEPILTRLRIFEEVTGTRIPGVKFYHYRNQGTNELSATEVRVDLDLR